MFISFFSFNVKGSPFIPFYEEGERKGSLICSDITSFDIECKDVNTNICGVYANFYITSAYRDYKFQASSSIEYNRDGAVSPLQSIKRTCESCRLPFISYYKKNEKNPLKHQRNGFINCSKVFSFDIQCREENACEVYAFTPYIQFPYTGPLPDLMYSRVYRKLLVSMMESSKSEAVTFMENLEKHCEPCSIPVDEQ